MRPARKATVVGERAAIALLAALVNCVAAAAAPSEYTISGRHVSVTVSISANATFVSSLSLAYVSGTSCADSGSAATRNLLLPFDDADALQASRTGLADGAGRWVGSSGGTVAARTPSSITITGIAVGAVAEETWLLTVDAPDPPAITKEFVPEEDPRVSVPV